MLAFWLENNSISLREDLPVPEPTPRSALVKVLLSGICATDLEIVIDYYPFKGVLWTRIRWRSRQSYSKL
jgi:D-arabinose 1-dehydrogenase-like Zn-dependent alcohol dehydrogenase